MTEARSSIFNLEGKVALFAGGAGYLGRCACEQLARHGAHVVIADLNQNAADRLADEFASRGLNVRSLKLDLGEEASIAGAIDLVGRECGRLDIAVNATTYSTGKAMDEMTLADWEAGLKVTLTGAFLYSREAARLMRSHGGGSIIHFSSMYGKVSPDPAAYVEPMKVNPVDYGAAKAALLQMVRYQAVAWAPSAIRVNAVVPGPFPNPDVQRREPDFVSRLARKVPLGRIGQASEIAGAVVYLASDASSFVTGTQIVVDGGWTAW